MLYKAPRATADLIDGALRRWKAFVDIAGEVFELYGYKPIETPIFEQSELFTRSAGESSDIATKEIFNVRSLGAMAKLKAGKSLKAEQRLALRPEGTAGVVRAIAEHNLVPQGGAPAKLWYAGPMFRAERPQKGRLREFHQVGIECLGATDAAADAEMIIMCMRFFEKLGLVSGSMRLLINSMGDQNCRPAYTEKLRDFEREHANELCEECQRRIDINPLRNFDCKNPACHEVMACAPRFSDMLCKECETRFSTVKSYLDDAHIAYEVDPFLVRGFDYYTGLVFEVQVKEGLGSQNAIGGGGHYDRLMGEISGSDLAGLGFAVGFERTMLALEQAGIDIDPGVPELVYVACVTPELRATAFSIMQRLRNVGVCADGDTQRRSLKAQFKIAGRAGARLVVIVGPDEVVAGQVSLRNMATHEQRTVGLDDVVTEVQKTLGA